jgi:hypothetical protein
MWRHMAALPADHDPETMMYDPVQPCSPLQAFRCARPLAGAPAARPAQAIAAAASPEPVQRAKKRRKRQDSDDQLAASAAAAGGSKPAEPGGGLALEKMGDQPLRLVIVGHNPRCCASTHQPAGRPSCCSASCTHLCCCFRLPSDVQTSHPPHSVPCTAATTPGLPVTSTPTLPTACGPSCEKRGSPRAAPSAARRYAPPPQA